MSTKTPFKVLVLCTGNSARSVIGEYLLRAKGKGRFEVYSAGSHPTGRVNPLAVWVLNDRYGIDASASRSKSWDEFKEVNFDFIITVCDNAKEACPVWPGKPVLAHWGSPDPASAEGTEDEKKQLFVQVASQISQRVNLLCSFPDEKLEASSIRQIGESFKLDNEAALKR